MLSTPCFRLAHAKFLLTHQICHYGKIVSKESHWKVTGGLYSFTIFFSTVHLREVSLALWTLKLVSASFYEGCPLTGV